DAGLWKECAHNPILLLQRLGPEGVAAALRRDGVEARVRDALVAREERRRRPPSLPVLDEAPVLVGYFSMEFGLAEALPIYAGGLGVLAGDHLKASSDLKLPLVGVGLLYRQGSGHQGIDEGGRQVDSFHPSDFDQLPIRRARDVFGEPLTVEAPIGSARVRLAVWRCQVGHTPLILLDSDLPENPEDLRGVTDRLYVPEPDRRLRQEIALGVGGVRALRALGVEPTVLHMNEGHGFLVAVERVCNYRQELGLDLERALTLARASLVFTTHTPVAAGSDYFDAGLVQALLGPYLAEVGIDLERFLDLGRKRPGDHQEPLCTTYVGLRLAGRSVGVSRLHGEVSRDLWRAAWPKRPESRVPIGAVTNGVHHPTWIARPIADLLREHVSPVWWELGRGAPEWAGIDAIPAEALWSAHQGLRRRLYEVVAEQAVGRAGNPDALIIGFSRRFAAYKRADLVLRDLPRLRRLLGDPDRPIQLVFAGKAHPADQPGKDILHHVVGTAREQVGVAFLVDYNVEVARYLVGGADIWLNNPQRFLEASGTSGMKAAANGALNLSILDGWWDEAYRPEIGWAIPSAATRQHPETDDGAEAAALLTLLEETVVPLYYDRDPQGIPQTWLRMMRASMKEAAACFSARRMVADYFWDCYVPAASELHDLLAVRQA
ncbi:MAG: alpha-glucan family phosphorylase, partial [Candidatus Dormibacteraeota bacterium]|nr:alpha-glucan family phosphorylase [Candidatus Dormibacteraeota bacterium]